MDVLPALRVALDLLHSPSQAPLIRAGQLPDGVLVLLRIAAGDEEALSQASISENRSRETIYESAAFFLEQILLHPGEDSYRVLGTSSEASHSELRRNMSLLLQWLHPDLDRREARSVFVARVTRAWNDLKTPERRAAYDRARRSVLVRGPSFRPIGSTPTPLNKTLGTRRARGVAQHRSRAYSRRPFIQIPALLRLALYFLSGRSEYRK
jgi:hypothetical protein